MISKWSQLNEKTPRESGINRWTRDQFIMKTSRYWKSQWKSNIKTKFLTIRVISLSRLPKNSSFQWERRNWENLNMSPIRIAVIPRVRIQVPKIQISKDCFWMRTKISFPKKDLSLCLVKKEINQRGSQK